MPDDEVQPPPPPVSPLDPDFLLFALPYAILLDIIGFIPVVGLVVNLIAAIPLMLWVIAKTKKGAEQFQEYQQQLQERQEQRQAEQAGRQTAEREAMQAAKKETTRAAERGAARVAEREAVQVAGRSVLRKGLIRYFAHFVPVLNIVFSWTKFVFDTLHMKPPKEMQASIDALQAEA